MQSTARRVATALGAVVLAASCAGPKQHTSAANTSTSRRTSSTRAANTTSSSPPTTAPIVSRQAYVDFSPADGRFVVKVPQGWTKATTGTSLTFLDRYNAVSVEWAPTATAPSVATARTQEVPAIAARSQRFRAGTVSMVVTRQASAVRISYEAAAPDPVRGGTFRSTVDRYEFWRSGLQVTVTVSALLGAPNDQVWQHIVNSFRWKSARRARKPPKVGVPKSAVPRPPGSPPATPTAPRP